MTDNTWSVQFYHVNTGIDHSVTCVVDNRETVSDIVNNIQCSEYTHYFVTIHDYQGNPRMTWKYEF
jgi:hypothetical protein